MINQALGRGSKRTIGGQSLQFSALTKNVQGDFQDWFIARLKGHAGDDLELKEAIAEAAAAGEYDFWSPKCLRAIKTPRGAGKLLHLLLEEHQPKLTEDEVMGLMESYPDELNEAITEALDMGNAVAPAVKN